MKELLLRRLALKAAEEKAIAERRAVDKQIADALAGPAEGSATNTVDGIKVTVTRKIDRKVDGEKLQTAWEFLPANVQATFRWKAELNTKHLRALQELGTEELKQASQFITSKPSTPSVDVELITE